MSTIYSIPADYGCLALLDIDSYVSFVGEDIFLNGIRSHLLTESRKGRIIAWGCPYGNWNIEVRVGTLPCKDKVRSYTGFLKTSGRLLLTDYDSLMTAAMFEDDKLPLEEGGGIVSVKPGFYSCKVVQCYEESSSEFIITNENNIHYILELNKVDEFSFNADIPWSEIQ